MKTVGIVFSNIHDKYLSELTNVRTLGSVPFAGRYRLIDFVLSNMVNSGVNKVGVITKNNYQSLMNHIGSGKDWDLSRKDGGVMLLPPFGTGGGETLYKTRLQALKGVMSFLNSCKEDYVIMSDCDKVLNIDFNRLTRRHVDTGADITVVYMRRNTDRETASKNVLYKIDNEGKITGVLKNPDFEGECNICLNIIMLRKTLLVNLVSNAVSCGYESFHMDILGQNTEKLKIVGYAFDGYYAAVDSLKNYFATNMEMLIKENRDKIFGIKERPVYTRTRDAAPAKYGKESRAINSIIADGCAVNGTVENSVLFRNVFVGKNSLVKNSIIMQDVYIGENVNLDYVIIDKNSVIRDRKNLTGCRELPYFVPKAQTL